MKKMGMGLCSRSAKAATNPRLIHLTRLKAVSQGTVTVVCGRA
ncbi:MAG: hypothetical protein R3E96_13270 [Planctomycetota bacterium]